MSCLSLAKTDSRGGHPYRVIGPVPVQNQYPIWVQKCWLEMPQIVWMRTVTLEETVVHFLPTNQLVRWISDQAAAGAWQHAANYNCAEQPLEFLSSIPFKIFSFTHSSNQQVFVSECVLCGRHHFAACGKNMNAPVTLGRSQLKKRR